MTGWVPWKIAKKEIKVIRRKRSVMIYTLALPLLLAGFFALVVKNDIATASGIISSSYELGLESLTYFFVIFAAIIPSSIAAYSIVGEKLEKSLEPLLATPVADREILLGKGLAAFLLPMASTWLGATIFMATTDIQLRGLLSFDYFPNWDSAVTLFVLAPLAAIMSIELSVIISSRVSDVRGANQIGGLMFIPFMAIFVVGIEGVLAFTVVNLLVLSVVVLCLDVALFFLSTAIFRREEILTKWK